MDDNRKMRVFLVDDEQLSLDRLGRMLLKLCRTEVVGETTEPLVALDLIPTLELDAIFVDIRMPELSGFELLARLQHYPPVIFVTAFEEYALRAFEVYSVDYLLKPVELQRLDRALDKLQTIIDSKSPEPMANIQEIVRHFGQLLDRSDPQPLEHLASRRNGHVRILNVGDITHFFSEDKVTLAHKADGRSFPLDFSLNELCERLDARKFVRVHRNAIVNVAFVSDVFGWFSGKVLVRLKDLRTTEIVVARDRVKVLKRFLGM